MNFYVLERKNATCETVGIVDTYRNVIWNPMYYGQGSFEMTVPATAEYVKIFQPHRIITRDVDMSPNGTYVKYKSPMVIKEINYSHDDENGAIMVVRGVSLKSHVLGSRVVTSYTYLNGNAEQSIYSVTKAAFIDTYYRKWQNFVNAPVKGYTNSTHVTLFGENIAEWMEETCRQHRFGWDMFLEVKPTNGTSYITFEIYKGTDRTEGSGNTPIIFSKEHDNLIMSELDIDYNNYATNCLVAGTEKPDSEEKWSVVTDYPSESNRPTGDERYEIYLDSGIGPEDNPQETNYMKVLNNAGLQELAQRKTLSFYAKVIPDGMYKLDKDYFLGDIVEVRTEYGIKAKARIEDIVYSIDESGTAVVITFGDWEVIE